MTQFYIQTPLQLNQSMMMKWTISWNSSTQSTMTIFYILTSICFKLDWWSPLLQNFIHDLLCCFINTEEQMLQSQISCHTFLWVSQPRPLWNWLMKTWETPIIVQVTLPKLYHQVPSSFILVLKILHLNLLNIVTLLNLKVVHGDYHTRLATILTIFN